MKERERTSSAQDSPPFLFHPKYSKVIQNIEEKRNSKRREIQKPVHQRSHWDSDDDE